MSTPFVRSVEMTAGLPVIAVTGMAFEAKIARGRGVAYLQREQREHGLWDETRFTATGFPRVFYLRYHGYRKFFPLWALARFRHLKRNGLTRVAVGM